MSGLQAVKAEEVAHQLERTRHLERQTQINKELEQLLMDDKYSLFNYLLRIHVCISLYLYTEY